MTGEQSKVRDMGIVQVENVKDGNAHTYFGSMMLNEHPIDETTGHSVDVLVPIPLERLIEAGVDVNDPDPYTGSVAFWADIRTPVDAVSDVNPTNIEPVEHMTQEAIDAWEGKIQ